MMPAKVTDLHADGTTAIELGLTHGPGFWGSYRGFRAPFQTMRFVTDVDAIDFGPVPPGGLVFRNLTITNNWDSDVEITSFVTTDPAFYVLDPVPLTIPVAGTVFGGTKSLAAPAEPGPTAQYSPAAAIANSSKYAKRMTNTLRP